MPRNWFYNKAWSKCFKGQYNKSEMLKGCPNYIIWFAKMENKICYDRKNVSKVLTVPDKRKRQRKMEKQENK